MGAFFSGGVDSCYTLVKSRLGLPSVADPITHLIFVKGFDAPLAEAVGLAASEARLREVARRYDCAVIAVETNLRYVLCPLPGPTAGRTAPRAAVAVARSGGARGESRVPPAAASAALPQPAGLASAAHATEEPPHDSADDHRSHPDPEQHARVRLSLSQAPYTETGVGEPQSDQGEAESEKDGLEAMHGVQGGRAET